MNGVISQAGADRSVRLPFQLKEVPILRDGQVMSPGSSVCLPVEDAFGRTPSMVLSEAVNALGAKGAGAESLCVRALFPETAVETHVRKSFGEIAQFCSAHHLSVIAPEAMFVPGLTVPVLSVTAFGSLFPGAEGNLPRRYFHFRVADPGTQVVLAGYAGSTGTGIIAGREKRNLEKRFPQALVADACGFAADSLSIHAASIACRFAPQYMLSTGEGGIFRALWMLGQEMNAGFELDLRAVSLRQETIEICEWLDVHPYQLYGSGALLIVTEDGDMLCEALLEAGIEARILGRMKNTPARVLVNGEDARYLEKPQPDSLWTYIGRKPDNT